MTEYVLGIDLGTTACKATILASDGRDWTVESKPCPTFYPQDGWVEQNPEHWWGTVRETVKRIKLIAGCKSEEIRSIGLTGQMHGLILLDNADRLLRPAILWSDHRSADQCQWILKKVPNIENITCNSLLPAFTLPKLIWVRDNELTTYQKISRILLPKDYIRYRLTGCTFTEPSDASGTSMYDVRNFSWSPEILSSLNIPMDWLPKCAQSSAITGKLTQLAAYDLALPPEIPVVGGGGDQAVQAIAMGVTQPGIVGLTIGTSGVIVMTRKTPVQGSFCHALDQRWLQLNAMHSAGLSLEWYRDSFHPEATYQELESIAQGAPVGSGDLIFMPFLLGERRSTRSHVPASFMGIRPQHNPSFFVRAIYEGVAFEFARMIKNWHNPGISINEVRFSGGGSKSNLWQVILANLLDLPVSRLEQGASFGACLLAGVGAGWWGSIEGGIGATLRNTQIEEPTSALRILYGDLFERYQKFYEILSRG
jgi:xylulokinase